MKRILGLDLGTTSIGWALVDEAEHDYEESSIIKLGVRVNPLSVDEQQNFEKGKSITTNADRTLKRSARRNLQRYKLRREKLIDTLKENQIITNETLLAESGNKTTFETYRLRAKAASERIELDEFARVLLMINKKRGYKSSRKVKSSEDGKLIDGMEVAKMLYYENLTPGQLSYKLTMEGKKQLPDYYRSDLQEEFNQVFQKQSNFHEGILSEELKQELIGKKRDAVWAICAKHLDKNGIELTGIKRTGNNTQQKVENLSWRAKGVKEKLSIEAFVIVIQDINTQINNSSGYLGAISDRSKELFFNKIEIESGQMRAQTVGEYQMSVLKNNPNASLKNMIFYRQDYMDEFDHIWNVQSKYHEELSTELKYEIRDIIIFYQRKLRSQKGLISFCEFENKKIEVEIDGKTHAKTIGSRVIPRSSPLFQEFKIWQILNNIEVFGKNTKSKKTTSTSLFSDVEDPISFGGRRELYQEEKELLAYELSVKKELKKADILKLLFDNYKELDLNYKTIQGNTTQYQLFTAYKQIIELSGHTIDINKTPAKELINSIGEIFDALGIDKEIIHFNPLKPIEEQSMYKLWHLLYSFEGDDSISGNEKLISKLKELYGFEKEFAVVLANITFIEDYGSLSAKAIKKIMPYLTSGNKYDLACEYANYRHSASSLTKEEIEKKTYKDRLEILPKNSLRNPVVEKILNQMINVINSIIDLYGKPDEIRIELARDLKKSASERDEMTRGINRTTKLHNEYKEILSKTPFNLSYISRNDIIKYKLYLELKNNGYKTLYSNTYIEPNQLFSGNFDIEHIIPQAKLFDDSFSNKTLEKREINIEKSDKTAFDFIKDKYGENGADNFLDNYILRIEKLYKDGSISSAKLNKLKMTENNIPSGFIERDIRDTQYIAKYAKHLLNDLVKNVVSTTGSITNKLREDWQLVDVMKELNWEKYNILGLTEEFENKDGHRIRRIKDWSKRNDHRHHAMDALTVAFTKPSYIQYLNNLNAKSDKSSSIYGIQQKEMTRNIRGKLLFKPPMELEFFREEAKKHLENTLISIKAKNKVTTNNINKTKREKGYNKITQQTPRGQLHNETIYGRSKKYVTKIETIGSKFNSEKIQTVANKKYREAIQKRLSEFDNDPKKAFTGKNSLKKVPIQIDEINFVPEKVKTVTFEYIYTIRKEITHELNIEKIVDKRVREILKNRLEKFGDDAKKAFGNLDEDPIWLNKEKGISIKRVTISGVANAEALHSKKDNFGKPILDEKGKEQPNDFVSTSNNHNVAIYKDKNGNLQENIVSFFEAVARANIGLPIIDKTYKKEEGWEFLFSMKQNEYFVFPNEETGFDPNEIDLMNPDNYKTISPNLFRVQKFAYKNYVFRHHLESTLEYSSSKFKRITWTDFRSSKGLDKIIKVRVNHIGMIVSVGEY